MKISYTGNIEAIPAKQRAKLEAKLQKLSKTLERRGEKEAHVVLTKERFLHKVEITVNAWDHSMVGIGTDGDITVAANEAVERLEKQILKLRERWRDTKRVRDKEADGAKGNNVLHPPAAAPKKVAPVVARAASRKADRKRVFRVNDSEGRKPMTLEEAMLEIETSQDYLVYRDAKTDRLTVLMRRADGHFDLIES
jgi:putative sigma-54 modulation protein